MTLYAANEAFLTEAEARASDCSCIDNSTPSQAIVLALIDAVSDTIARLTGMRIAGRQDVIARPCYTGDVYCQPCPCCGLDYIPLGDDSPTVTQVKIDGAVIAANLYEMHWVGHQWGIIRLPDYAAGETSPPSWPTSQNVWALDTATDTVAIRFTQGVEIDQHVIKAAAIELLCDFAQDDTIRARALEGAVQVNAGGASIVRDRNLVRTSDETALDRINRGETGPMVRRMMGLLAPKGAAPSAIWSPDMMSGWRLNLRLAP